MVISKGPLSDREKSRWRTEVRCIPLWGWDSRLRCRPDRRSVTVVLDGNPPVLTSSSVTHGIVISDLRNRYQTFSSTSENHPDRGIRESENGTSLYYLLLPSLDSGVSPRVPSPAQRINTKTYLTRSRLPKKVWTFIVVCVNLGFGLI